MIKKLYHKTADGDRQVCVLGFDLGSGGHKIALISDRGDVAASTEEKTAARMLPTGGAEQDPKRRVAKSFAWIPMLSPIV